MTGKLQGWNDTIVALATPSGIGAIGVIRISGEKTYEIVNEIFVGKNLFEQPSHTLHYGVLKYKGVVIDEVVASLFKQPASYTGEDVIEISCHGSHYMQQQIIDIITKLGARLAKPGEFTQRAFLNGKLDLAQAEAVADLIASNTEASRKTALQNMRGGFSEALKEVRAELLQFAALIELELDFSQEDVEFADRRRLYKLLTEATGKVRHLLESFKLGNVIKNGVQVAIIGKPNAGKSTLLNSLLNEERAIVSEIAGTTRDTIEETLNINGILFRLIDTAGIREHTMDTIETIGVERSHEKMRNADIVLYLFDINETTKEDLTGAYKKIQNEGIKLLLVGNKSDELKNEQEKNKYAMGEEVLFISARDKQNIELLKQRLYEAVVDKDLAGSNTIVTNARHVEALGKVQSSLEDVMDGLNNKIPGDLLALDIRTCLHYLGEITGEITNEEKLDYIFSKFCIGK